MMVKGENVPVDQMGRMIDPYLFQDKDHQDKWWCSYKQNGVSMSFTYDFRKWQFYGQFDAGENVCVILGNNGYILVHSPENGIGFKRSHDLVNWNDEGLYTLGQGNWPWAKKRITAGHILDLRSNLRIERFLMFFHGGAICDLPETHGCASLALAWIKDLIHWEWPK